MDTDSENIKEITQVDKELTELELNRIFFGSESAAIIPDTDLSSTEKKENSSAVQKLERIKPTPKTVLLPDPSPVQEPSKRPQGRPLKWTEEKIEQAKRENAALAEQRRKERLEMVSLSKLSIPQSLSERATSKLLNSTITSKDEVEKQISEKRTILKNIQNEVHQFSFLRGGEKTHEHLFKLNHFDTYGNIIACCESCSVREQMTPQEWAKYISKNRKIL
jgi:hypothetical protein